MIGNDAGDLLPQDVYGETALDRLKDHAENGTMHPRLRKDLGTVLDLATRTTSASAGVLVEALAAMEELANTRMDMSLERWSQLSSVILASLANRPADDGELRAALAQDAENEALFCKQAQAAANASGEDRMIWYRMGQKDALMLFADRIRAFVLPPQPEGVKRP